MTTARRGFSEPMKDNHDITEHSTREHEQIFKGTRASPPPLPPPARVRAHQIMLFVFEATSFLQFWPSILNQEKEDRKEEK